VAVGAYPLGLLAIVAVAVCALTVLPHAAPGATPAPAQAKANPNELILCGWDEVLILNLSQREDGKPKKVWSWQANGHPDLPWHGQDVSFGATDECKPVDGGRKILITSSGLGVGVALVDRASRKVLFWARAENAHSADLLPDGRVAVATSVHEVSDPPLNPDRLTIYDAATSGKELYHTDLPAGHGVVWDDARQVLWALANQEIRAYRLANWQTARPSLEAAFSVELPEGGAHDLYPVPSTPLMTVTTYGHCWLFDRDTHGLRPHPQLGQTGYVKSISVNPATGQLAYVQAEGEEWWAERVHLLQPDSVLHLPGERLYKARWNVPIR
jgi:hypothetical protein